MIKRSIGYLGLVLLVSALLASGAAAEEEYAWVHRETLFRWGAGDWEPLSTHERFERLDGPNHVVAEYENNTVEIRITSPGRNSNHPPRVMHVVYDFTPPAPVIHPGSRIEIPVYQEIFDNVSGGLFSTISASADLAQSQRLRVAQPHPVAGETSVVFGLSTRDIPELWEETGRFVLAGNAWQAGSPGREQRLGLSFGTHSSMGGTIQIRYWYDWQPIPEATREYSAWQPDSDPNVSHEECVQLRERYAALVAAMEEIVSVGEEFRAASPDFLADLRQLLDEHR